jgi:hypothetical protein
LAGFGAAFAPLLAALPAFFAIFILRNDELPSPWMENARFPTGKACFYRTWRAFASAEAKIQVKFCSFFTS